MIKIPLKMYYILILVMLFLVNILDEYKSFSNINLIYSTNLIQFNHMVCDYIDSSLEQLILSLNIGKMIIEKNLLYNNSINLESYKELQLNNLYTNIAISDKYGTILVANKSIVVNDRKYFQYHSENNNNTIFFDSPIKSRFDDSWTIIMSIRINKNNEFYGVLLLSINVKYFENVFKTIIENTGTNRITILNNEGYLTMRFPTSTSDIEKLKNINYFKYQSGMENITSTIILNRISPITNEPLKTAISKTKYGQFYVLDSIKMDKIYNDWMAVAIYDFMVLLFEIMIISIIFYYLNKNNKTILNLFNEKNYITEELKKSIISEKKANKAKTFFLANMNHELRTPLNAIIGFSEMLQCGLFNHKIKEYSSNIYDSGNILLCIVNDLLEYSSLDHDMVSIDFRPINMISFFDTINHTINFHQKNITIGYNIEDINFTGDEKLLKEVFINILSNAVKYNKDNGFIYVNVHTNDNFISFIIKDTGIGISAERLETIFEPFNYTNTEIAKDYPGAGLGLYFCKKYIEIHNGFITIDSTYGKETIVKILLPQIQIT